MFSFDFIKIYVFLALVLLLFPSCRYGQKIEGETSASTPFAVEELKNKIPFSTKEPEIFQTEIVVSANGQERVYFVARNGENLRFDYNFTDKNRVSILQTDKNYLIFPDKKIYAEAAGGEIPAASDDWTKFLTTEWLNERTEANFERLDAENNLVKYRVRFNESDLSESVIYVDENLGFPVKQEFFSINGEQRTLNFTVELRNLKRQTDENTFSIPKDFRKVSIAEFRKISGNLQD
jgi:hypothetical protein